ncbi:MAG: tyrosine-type recombinase/integrase [Chloroflexi bacterium]|nr:tyrosine-type recombinase/integrase [Chloroflexota bacterium]
MPAHRDRQTFFRQIAGDQWIGTNHVFTKCNDQPVHPRDLREGWQILLKRARIGRHMRFHGTRPTCTTLLRQWGVPFEVRMAILGHAEVSTALLYTPHRPRGPRGRRQANGRHSQPAAEARSGDR